MIYSWPSEALGTVISADAFLAFATLGTSYAVLMSAPSGRVSATSPMRVPDALTGAGAQDVVDIQDRVRRCVKEHAGVSAVTIIVNPNVLDEQASRVARLVGADVSALVIRVRPGISWRRHRLTRGVLLDCSSPDDLPQLIAKGTME